MSNQELWNLGPGADAALGAMDAGAVPHLWKVSGQRWCRILDLPDRRAWTARWPGFRSSGDGRLGEDELLPIYDYRTFAEDLKEAVGG